MPPTPNIQRIVAELQHQFGPRLRFEYYNRRRINNKPWNRWSQHAGAEPDRNYWGNAADIFDQSIQYDSPLLTQANTYLIAHTDRLQVRTLLWKVPNHHNHIHVDTWPMMKDNRWYRPPPKGPLITIDENGATGDTFHTDEEANMPFLPMRKGDGEPGSPQHFKRSDVAAIQGMLNRAYNAGLDTDGWYGDLTVEAIRNRWVGETGLVFTGNMYDDLHWDLAVKAGQTLSLPMDVSVTGNLQLDTPTE